MINFKFGYNLILHQTGIIRVKIAHLYEHSPLKKKIAVLLVSKQKCVTGLDLSKGNGGVLLH